MEATESQTSRNAGSHACLKHTGGWLGGAATRRGVRRHRRCCLEAWPSGCQRKLPALLHLELPPQLPAGLLWRRWEPDCPKGAGKHIYVVRGGQAAQPAGHGLRSHPRLPFTACRHEPVHVQGSSSEPRGQPVASSGADGAPCCAAGVLAWPQLLCLLCFAGVDHPTPQPTLSIPQYDKPPHPRRRQQHKQQPGHRTWRRAHPSITSCETGPLTRGTSGTAGHTPKQNMPRSGRHRQEACGSVCAAGRSAAACSLIPAP